MTRFGIGFVCLCLRSVALTVYAEGALYLMIDLSGGPDATHYPVSYTHVLPSEPTDIAYKTTQLVMRRIPAGSFIMGSPQDEKGRSHDEHPHEVTLSGDFYMGVYPVTQRQWELVMGTRPSFFSEPSVYAERPVERVSYSDIRGAMAGAGWPTNRDVDASSFMGRLREKTGLSAFDLPTEAQWEYACRAGTTTALNSGKDLTDERSCAHINEVGYYWYVQGEKERPHDAPVEGTLWVGSSSPNAWGLYDMHGNVREWCLDWYGAYPGAVTDPPGERQGTRRVFRGGCWSTTAKYWRSAKRFHIQPSYKISSVGFRVVKTDPAD